jgi:hypothetical protein
MDRNLVKPYVPSCPRNIGVVDQYSWEHKDTNDYMCENGISHPIYDCNGWAQFSLPLEMYPPRNEIHPQIKMVKRMHLNWRGDEDQLNRMMEQNLTRRNIKDNDKRLEGFYHDPYLVFESQDLNTRMRDPAYDSFSGPPRTVFTSNKVPGSPLPDPYVQQSSCRGLY